ncbi:uncharacterized protein TRAVEDRAFT_51725 [Trametes versicolor FP-101664 SS1]|uniref:uncharacterized protein n=1 Tax=Trametes versicolor (strain FP-101664) TaxID=717944 RepID=UPI0004622A36|nr:uncharacterized protein TRAVEDRAFT_51725 [Trametes versicolor FP-101664 SS1]EIW53991.1 hypothetical protein TRAVEDRAFT_51725 [Trametes versicolor FP-101664 SS1]
MARVCKAFSSSAIDVLWRNLDDFEDLLHVFPFYQDWDDRTVSEIPPHMWERFQMMVWTLLEYRSGGQPLLPRLQTLTLLNIDPHFVQPLVLLLTPSLRTLVLSFGDSEASGWDEVAPMATRSSRSIPTIADLLLRITGDTRLSLLTNLRIDHGGLPEDFPPSHFASLAQLSGLKTLDLLYSGVAIDTATLQLLSNIPSIRSLDLEISLDEITFRGPLQPGGAELNKLHLCGSIGDLRRFFDAATLPNVVDLALSVTSLPNIGALKDAFDLICSKISRSVHELTVFVNPVIPSPAVSLLDILRPSLSFRDMNTLNVEFDEYFLLIDDQDALAFASAWPLLTSFSYHSYADIPKNLPTQTTVAGLLTFAQRCPELCGLDLPLLDVRAPLPPPLSIPAVGQKFMRHLQIPEFIGGDTADLVDLALILDRLFSHYECGRPLAMQAKVVPFVLDCEARHRPVRMTDLLVEAMQAQRRLLEDDGSRPAAISE